MPMNYARRTPQDRVRVPGIGAVPGMGNSYLQPPQQRTSLDDLVAGLPDISPRMILFPLVGLLAILAGADHGRAVRMRRLERMRAASEPYPHGQQSQEQRTPPPVYQVPWASRVGIRLHQAGERLGAYPVTKEGRQSGVAADGFPLQ
jgi:hypothetical protein